MVNNEVLHPSKPPIGRLTGVRRRKEAASAIHLPQLVLREQLPVLRVGEPPAQALLVLVSRRLARRTTVLLTKGEHCLQLYTKSCQLGGRTGRNTPQLGLLTNAWRRKQAASAIHLPQLVLGEQLPVLRVGKPLAQALLVLVSRRLARSTTVRLALAQNFLEMF